MSLSSVLRGLLNANFITIFLCFYFLQATSTELVASSPRLVPIGQRFQALCHYERSDVHRFLYWTIHYHNVENYGQEFEINLVGIDLTDCSAFSFNESLKTDLLGLTGQIICDLDGGPMRLYINKVRPEYNRLRFSCNSGRKNSAPSNKVTLMVGKPQLVTLEIEATGDYNHTAGFGTALRATCRVDKSLNPMFLYWATSNIEDAPNKSTFGGMIVDFCYRYHIRGLFHRRVDFNCRGPPDVSSTLTVQSLPFGTAIFCYAMINSGPSASRIESNRLTISGSGHFTKVSISTNNSSVPISGMFYAKCRLLSSEYYYDRIMWHGVSKFGERAHIINSKEQKESALLIEPIYATDNQSQILCGIVGEPVTHGERIIIKVIRKVPISLEILRNESTMKPVPKNGMFRAVCSFRNTDAQAVHWVATADHVIVGRVNISHDVCRTYIMITNTVTANRVQISCDLTAKTTTFSVQPVRGHDAGTEIYCTTADQFGPTIRSDSLSIMMQNVTGEIVKTRPAYTEATLAASCPFGNGTEHVFMVLSADKDGDGSEKVRTGNVSDFKAFILHDRNCTVIDYASNLPRRFFVDCNPDSESFTLVIDPVYGNASDDFRVTCVWYATFPSSNASSTPERKLLLQKRQIPHVVYPVSKPALTYSGDLIKLNDTEPDIWNSVWLIPATPDQEMEFSCSAGDSQSSTFNLSLYIQTDKGYSFRVPDRTKKPNGTTQTPNIRLKFRMETSYVGVFCVAENIVSRWESDFARMLLNMSVFIALDGWLPPDSSFLKRNLTTTLKLCYTLCEFNNGCRGVSYNHKLCSLSSRGFQDSKFSPKEGFSFHHRLLLEDVLQRNNFWPDVYIKHENQTIPFRGDLDRRTGLTVTQCQKRCSKFVPCRSILFSSNGSICHLYSLKPAEIETTIRNRYNWDVYTKNNTPGSFIAIRGVLPGANFKPVNRFSPVGPGKYERLLMQCADFCRVRDDCVSFVSTFDEHKKSMICFVYDINIPELRLVEHAKSKSKGSFYVRVRSIHSQLVPVNRPEKLGADPSLEGHPNKDVLSPK